MQREPKEIITDEVELSERSDEINVISNAKNMRNIIADIKATMRKKDIKALSAPAIGYKYRIFCVSFEDLEIKTFINPMIVNAVGLVLSKESSVTIPGKTFIRPRNSEIKLMYQDPLGKTQARQFNGLAASVVQQMCDDLDGVFLSDVGLEIDEDYENASDEEKQEVINAYLDALDIKKKELDEEIESNEDLKRIRDAANFINSVRSGETKLDTEEEDK